ncbi:MAG: hypothetical protein M1449_02535 [Candidatus Thermoplasmatota archaeon]|nr:hypothetical protein [Candidatus Thermoplasmatota archaeon]
MMRTGGFQSTVTLNGSEFAGALSAQSMCWIAGLVAAIAMIAAHNERNRFPPVA